MAEDLLAVTLTAAAGGLGTVAWPLLDRGIDLYLRRRRTLLTLPIQVKAFHALNPDGIGSLNLPLDSISEHPGGSMAMVHLPEPYDMLYDRLFLIPFVEFRKRCPRQVRDGKEFFQFAASFPADTKDALWSQFALSIEQLPAWLDATPGWTRSMPPVEADVAELSSPADKDATRWRGEIARLWAAAEIERAAGPAAVVIAEDRVRLDHVTLLVHHLASHRFAGLSVHASKITSAGHVHLLVRRVGFFLDDHFYVLLLPIGDNERPYDFCLLIPSSDLPHPGSNNMITLDPLSENFAPYKVPIDQFGAVFLSKVFGS